MVFDHSKLLFHAIIYNSTEIAFNLGYSIISFACLCACCLFSFGLPMSWVRLCMSCHDSLSFVNLIWSSFLQFCTFAMSILQFWGHYRQHWCTVTGPTVYEFLRDDGRRTYIHTLQDVGRTYITGRRAYIYTLRGGRLIQLQIWGAGLTSEAGLSPVMPPQV